MTWVYLEGACGHEFSWNTADGAIPPSEGICEEHGLTALWAQRLDPRRDEPLPRGRLRTEQDATEGVNR